MDSPESPEQDELSEFVDMMQAARDRAYWLSVVRGRRAAGYLETILKALLDIARDDAAEFRREQRNKSSAPPE